MAARTITIALTGNPNAGKTTIFNNLTGARQHVGNWPGETVERVATFGEGGVLHVKAIKNNAPMKAYVKVDRQNG